MAEEAGLTIPSKEPNKEPMSGAPAAAEGAGGGEGEAEEEEEIDDDDEEGTLLGKALGGVEVLAGIVGT